MEIKNEYKFCRNLDSSLSDYSSSTYTNYHNEDYKKAKKNSTYFSQFSNNILFSCMYKCFDSSKEGIVLQSCGILTFYDEFFAYSNKKAFSFLQGIVKYSDISELSVIVTKNIVLSGGTLLIFLNNNNRMDFSLTGNASKYMLSKLAGLSIDDRFPFNMTFSDNDQIVNHVKYKRFIFFHE